jgi:hypothetical protein
LEKISEDEIEKKVGFFQMVVIFLDGCSTGIWKA